MSGLLHSQSAKINISPDLNLKPLTERLWIHTSTIDIPKWGPVPANGLAHIIDDHLLIVDTPWNGRQTADLVSWFKRNYIISDVSVIICHYHQDNLGGLEWIQQMDYNSYSIERTREICREKGLPVPEIPVAENGILSFNQSIVEVFFPGPGHTDDSIAVYFPEEQVLYGGCSVKALSNKTLGNTADADLVNWPESLQRLKRVFSEARIVVPGHGREGSLDLIDHSINLF